MIIRVTEKPTYRRCRRKWRLTSSNGMHLTRAGISPVFGLGLAVHEALARWMVYDHDIIKHAFYEDKVLRENQECDFTYPDGSQCGVKENNHYSFLNETFSLSHEYMLVCARMVSEAQTDYKIRTGAEMSDEELGPFMDVVMLGHAMMDNYQNFWNTPLPPNFTLVAPEQDIVVDIPHTEHTSEWLYMPDHSEGERYGEDGIIVDVAPGGMCKVSYDTPRLHKLGGRLDAIIKDDKGRIYAPDHKTYSSRPREEVLRYDDQFTSYTWMLTQVPELGKVAGIAYDGMWKRAKPPKGSEMKDLFTRCLIMPSSAELQEFQQMLAWEALEMASNPPITKDRRWDGSCVWGCGVDAICRSMMHGEDANFIIKSQYVKRDPTAVAVADKDE